MIRSASDTIQVPVEPTNAPTDRMHFFDENSNHFATVQRRSNKENKNDSRTMNSLIDGAGAQSNDNHLKLKRHKEPSYAMSRFLEIEDGAYNSIVSF